MCNIKKLVLLFIIFTLIFSFTGCAEIQDVNSSKPAESQTDLQADPIKITDVEGREVELKKPAQKIVDCTGLGGVRILIQLEAEDLLVGATDKTIEVFKKVNVYGTIFHPVSKAAPELKDLPDIGAYNEPDVQKIISLNPDVILVGWGGKELADSLYKQTGIPTVCIGRMDGHFDYDLYEIVGKVIGKENKAAELTSYLKETLKVVTNVTNNIPENEKKSIYFWIYPVIGNAPRSNGIYDAFEYAGAINVASTDQGIALYETSNEQIAAWDPEYIFLQSYKADLEGYHTMDTLKKDPVLKNMQAVKNNKVYNLRGPASDWDTAIEGTEVFYVAKILYPDLFKDLDVEKYGNEIMKKFYGVDGLYTEMREFAGLHNFK